MFTGIIETIGRVTDILPSGTNKTFWITSSFSDELKIDQSVAHNGACFTVEEIKKGHHRVTAIRETLGKTNFNAIQIGDAVNLERCLRMNGRLDGHIVQGHIDSIAKCVERTDLTGSWKFRFRIDPGFAVSIIEKGSITLDGISLTIFDVNRHEFSVAIIPYTFENTNIQHLLPGMTANVEFDLIGKYVARIMNLQN